jgi:DNA repair exonuclease SbcCD ATPase subunit
MSNGTTAPQASQPGWAERAAEREIRRQKRLSLVFIVLLIMPLVVAWYFFTYGRTDRQFVHDEVDRRVAPIESVARDIGPAVASVEAAAARAQAAVAQVAQQEEVVRSHLQRINELHAAEADSNVSLEDLNAQLQELRPSIMAAQALAGRLNEIERSLRDSRERVDRIARDQESILQREKMMAGELQEVRKRVIKDQHE